MRALLDFLTFKVTLTPPERPSFEPDLGPGRKDREAAIRSEKDSVLTGEIESANEYRLASLIQYPHF
jgi:hypothetical protein